MLTIYIDGKKYYVKRYGQNILQTCLSLGLDIPYFCWHPVLNSVGSCRQCVVKQYTNIKDTDGKLIISCMTPTLNESIITINDDESKKFRASIIELLMINHPHDCPVCEEGGNCHLQDMTVMTGHTKRTYRFQKRTHYNQNLGPFIGHEMNRCITCYRCIRYYQDYADGTDFGVYGVHDNIYFGRIKDGTLENEFSGNLIEICPTGVFTDKTHSKYYNRKWDMQYSPGICQQCSIGCNISPGERYGRLRRIENRYHGLINHYFLCDRGRFGYGYVNCKDRPQKPQLLVKEKQYIISSLEAQKHAIHFFKKAKKIIGIGSPRSSIENNYALLTLVGKKNFYAGISQIESNILKSIINILQNGGIYTPSLREIEYYDAILILGEDITQTSARMALAVRQAIKSKAQKIAKTQKISDWQISSIFNIGQKNKYPLFITSIDNTRLDDIATFNYYAPIINQARFGFAIANHIDQNAPEVNNLPIDIVKQIKIIAKTLLQAEKPLIISGSNMGNEDIIHAAANIALSLKNKNIEVGISYLAAEANSLGLALMDAQPLDIAIKQINSGIVDVAIIMENDLYRHSYTNIIDNIIKKLDKLIVIDHQRTSIMNNANLVLPAASFAESSGTLINNEGRAQRYFKVFEPQYYDSNIDITESWRWLHLLHTKFKQTNIQWLKLDHVIQSCIKDLPQFKDIIHAAPNSSFNIHGQKLARSSHRSSGRTSILTNVEVNEHNQPDDIDTPFTFSIEGNNSPMAIRQHISFAWSPGWNSPQAWNKFQSEIGGNLRFGDSGIRLFHKNNNNNMDYFTNIPINWTKQNNEWTVAPYYHLFGSDETSQRAEIIKKHMSKNYIMLNIDDAKKMNINIGENIEFHYAGKFFCLPVRISHNLMPGQIGLPLGMPGIAPTMAGVIITNLKKEY